MEKLNLALVNTQLPGIVMYRLTNFAKNMKRDFNVLQPEIDMAGQRSQAWEYFLREESVANALVPIINKADIIVFQRFNNPKNNAIIRAIRLAEQQNNVKVKKIIGFEIDDYMFNVPEGNMARATFAAGSAHFNAGIEQLQLSDFVVVSTNYLKEKYKQYNRNIFVVDNHIDMDWWGGVARHKESGKKLRIGWAGANGHSEDLKILNPVIEKILEKYGDKVEFYFYAPIVPITERDGVVVEKGYVPLLKYPKKLKSLNFDIGVVPLRDHDFNRAKSHNRYLELGLTGIPVIASAVGQTAETIKHGENGYLAETQGDFYTHLCELIDNAELRVKMGASAQDYIKENYNAKVGGKKYVEMIKQARRVVNEFPNNR